jgi:ABC-type transport system substrate-binding protein
MDRFKDGKEYTFSLRKGVKWQQKNFSPHAT